jgi:hypothetical protein
MKKTIRLTESELTNLIKKIIKENNEVKENWFSKMFKKEKPVDSNLEPVKKDISDFTREELDKIWINVDRFASPGFFDEWEAEGYLLHTVANGDEKLFNSLVDWFEKDGRNEYTIGLLRYGIFGLDKRGQEKRRQYRLSKKYPKF